MPNSIIRFDSTGKAVAIRYLPGSYLYGHPFYDGGVIVNNGSGGSVVLDKDLNIIAQNHAKGSAKSADMDKDGNIYGAYITTRNRDLNLGDTIIPASWELRAVLAKFDKDGVRKWTHVADANADFEINANKSVRCDAEGNVFWTFQYTRDVTVDGRIIPFYKQYDTLNFAIKAAVLRFNSNTGELLSTHYDQDTIAPGIGFRQSIWLETLKDMKVLAYIASAGLKTFDKINFGSSSYMLNRMSPFDYTSNAFTYAWMQNGERYDHSMLAHRHIFWRSLSSSYTFSSGVQAFARGNNDLLFVLLPICSTSWLLI